MKTLTSKSQLFASKKNLLSSSVAPVTLWKVPMRSSMDDEGKERRSPVLSLLCQNRQICRIFFRPNMTNLRKFEVFCCWGCLCLFLLLIMLMRSNMKGFQNETPFANHLKASMPPHHWLPQRYAHSSSSRKSRFYLKNRYLWQVTQMDSFRSGYVPTCPCYTVVLLDQIYTNSNEKKVLELIFFLKQSCNYNGSHEKAI